MYNVDNDEQVGYFELNLADYDWFFHYCNKPFFNHFVPLQKFVYLRYIFVNVTERQQGYGTKMLEYIDQYIKENFNNVQQIVILSYPFNAKMSEDNLLKFYKKHGFNQIVFPNEDKSLYRDCYETNVLIKNLVA